MSRRLVIGMAAVVGAGLLVGALWHSLAQGAPTPTLRLLEISDGPSGNVASFELVNNAPYTLAVSKRLIEAVDSKGAERLVSKKSEAGGRIWIPVQPDNTSRVRAVLPGQAYHFTVSAPGYERPWRLTLHYDYQREMTILEKGRFAIHRLAQTGELEGLWERWPPVEGHRKALVEVPPSDEP